MLTMLDVLALFSAALPWMQRAQVRRLERFGEGVPFAEASQEAIARAQHMALAEGAQAVTPLHLAQAALEFRAAPSHGAGSPRERAVVSDAERAAGRSLPFTYPAFVVLAECLRVAANDRSPAATPEHLLLAILRKRTRQATRFLASRGVTVASIGSSEHHVTPTEA